MRVLICFLCAIAMLPASGSAQEPATLMTAETMAYDDKAQVATAQGKVEIMRDGKVLFADRVIYHQAQDVVVAEGNISLMEPDGTVYFADKIELKEGLKLGAVEGFSARLADNSLFTARRAVRTSETATDLFSAVYTPCRLTCDEGKPQTPTWHLNAEKINVDQAAQTITYHDATLDFLDVPVLYTPYFSHPTPGADNKSGFLTPNYRYSKQLGSVVEIPYYYVIGQDQDVTLTPIITTQEGLVGKGEYRKRFNRGDVLFEGSGTFPKDRDVLGREEAGRTFRGHVDAKGEYALSPDWFLGGQLRRTTDDTYLRRYRFGNDPLLTSRAYLQSTSFLGQPRHYAQVQALAFQGLTAADNRRQSPYIFPLAEFGMESEPLAYGGRASLTSNVMALTRKEGTDSQRFSSTLGYNVPLTTDTGHVFEASAQLRGDIYSIHNYTLAGRDHDGVESRLIPQASLAWRYPLMRRGNHTNIIIEPTAGIIVSPNVGAGSEDDIPNEDSAIPEFTDLNMFSTNRYSGYDRVESGPRMFVGARSMVDMFENGTVSTALGQTTRLNDTRQFPLSNDLTSRISDYVGRVSYHIFPVEMNYRFRLDRDSLERRRDEFDMQLNQPRWAAQASYLRFNDDPVLGSSEEVNVGGSLNLTKHWTLGSSLRKDLERNRLTNTLSTLKYQDDCFTFVLGAGRDLANDRDIDASTSITAQVSFKNLD